MNKETNLSIIWDSYSEINSKKHVAESDFPFFDLLDIKKSDKLLDVGCGTGAYMSMLSKYSDNIIGIDISQQMLVHAKSRELSLLCLADFRGMPFRDNEFDMVYSLLAINYVKNWEDVIVELSRILKPGGRCVIVGANTKSIFLPFRKLFHFAKLYKYGATYHTSITSISKVASDLNMTISGVYARSGTSKRADSSGGTIHSLLTQLDKIIGKFVAYWGAELAIHLVKK